MTLPRLAQLLADPPLDPSPDEARSRLRRELLKPEYHDQSVVQRLLDWLERQLGRTIDATSSAGPLQTLAALLVLAGLVLGLTWLLSQARRTARAAPAHGGVLTGEAVSAAELRARAELALAEARHEDAVVEAYRALALRQVERGRIDDRPGATAHEVAGALTAEHPGRRAEVERAAALFDLVMYGERPATREQAVSVLALDDELAAAR